MNVYILIVGIIFAFGSTIILALILRNKISEMGVKSELSGSMIFSYSLVTAGAFYGVWYGLCTGIHLWLSGCGCLVHWPPDWV